MNLKLKTLSGLSSIYLFADENQADLAAALGDCEVSEYQPEEMICREGEYDENCHVILSGMVRVGLPRGSGGRGSRIILSDGEVFGEIAAMSGAPRTADIIAMKPSIILNISRSSMFSLLDKFGSIKKKMDALYRERALRSQLMKIPMFSGVSESFVDGLVDRVQMGSYAKGDVIFNEGDDADAFYLIRYGFVKVSQNEDGKEKALAYLKEGHCFGEMALLNEGEKRMATISAINRVEVIKIAVEDFSNLLSSYPGIRRNLESAAGQREDRNVQISQDANLANTLRTTIEDGVISTKSLLIMDTTKCVQCDTCVEACAALHNGKSRLVRIGAKINSFIFIPTSCRNCEDPTCMAQCPTGAITRDSNGEIYHKDFCIGCGGCAGNCPFGNITISELDEDTDKGIIKRIYALMFDRGSEKGESQYKDLGRGPGGSMAKGREADAVMRKRKKKRKAVKCDMCRGFSYMGCVYNCPTGAARRVDPTEFFSDLTSVG
ncbi:MAG: cyclic nucleotide-binding domain-containing protein [Nitrospinota bacterium]|nr:cyclic nucleotide-binding domain-containing protein [Nitrospinota bacterium]